VEPAQGRAVKQPGQTPDTLSYDRPRSQDDAPATPRVNAETLLLQGDPPQVDPTPRERPKRTDPHALAPAPQQPLVLTPPEAPQPQAEMPTPPPIEPPTGAFAPGTRLDHFEIVSLVGKGGMGCVYKAHDRTLGRTVAIKTLHGINQQEPSALARFRREAQAASRVVHPNLVIIHSYGTHEQTPYIVMEYLSGHNLAVEIANGPLTPERTADILVPACAGVHAAHRAGVVHRDIKPGNIFLARTLMGETPKILDFGISRVGGDDANLTGTGDIIGTTYYLAPEQAAGQEVDAAADQYALGVILYECLTGARPFTGSAAYTIIRSIVEGVFQPPSQLRPDIPHDLEAVILRAMSRLPNDRFATVRDLGVALMPFMSAQGRQQWSHHFTVPESEMPAGPSMAMPISSGENPGRTQVAPVQAVPVRMATKVLSKPTRDAWQATPTRTGDEPPSFPLTSLTPTDTPVFRRSHRGLALAVSGVLLVLAIAAWFLRDFMVTPAKPAAVPTMPVAPPAAPTPAPTAAPPAAPTPAPTAAPPAAPAPPLPTRAAAARPAPKATPTPRKRSQKVKFTVDGVPII
jgi:eukaryotic-like serine/threonine-protein kinase